MLVNLLTKPLVAFCLSFLIFSVSCAKAIHSKDPGWVASAGAMITLFGILLTTRSLLRHGTVMEAYEERKFSISSLPALGDEAGVEEHNQKAQQKLTDVVSERYGFWFLLVGTIVWAYGDRAFSYILCII